MTLRDNAISASLALTLVFALSPRSGATEIAYDDGVKELTLTMPQGTLLAVRFTPPSYPVEVQQARAHIGGFNAFQCDVYTVTVLDDDGPEGSPGTVLLGPVDIDATPSGWINCPLPSPVTIDSGDFYIAFTQYSAFDCYQFNSDLTAPHGRSWANTGSGWNQMAPSDGDVMIRAEVSPTGATPTQPATWGGLKALYR